MSSKKGLSKDQKKTRMLEIFHETGEVFTYKDIEKIAQKEKGIVLQSVKSILQELVDDGVVETKKCSGTLIYWAFKNKKAKVLTEKIDNLRDVLNKENSHASEAQEILDKLQDRNYNMAEIEKIQSEISDLNKIKADLEGKLKVLREHNPKLAQKKLEDAKVSWICKELIYNFIGFF